MRNGTEKERTPDQRALVEGERTESATLEYHIQGDDTMPVLPLVGHLALDQVREIAMQAIILATFNHDVKHPWIRSERLERFAQTVVSICDPSFLAASA